MPATVLVVDDEEATVDIVRRNLELSGFRVRQAVDATQALAQAAREQPDLILLDVMIRHLDGWSVLERLQEDTTTSSIPVLLVTARTMPADQLRGYNCGAVGFISKPFSADDLMAKVHDVLADARLRQGHARFG
ncbi:MAG: response regulator [Euzebyales bacterium]|nr:response regulator [Euzebyales bacterium]